MKPKRIIILVFILLLLSFVVSNIFFKSSTPNNYSKELTLIPIGNVIKTELYKYETFSVKPNETITYFISCDKPKCGVIEISNIEGFLNIKFENENFDDVYLRESDRLVYIPVKVKDKRFIFTLSADQDSFYKIRFIEVYRNFNKNDLWGQGFITCQYQKEKMQEARMIAIK